MTLTKDDPKVTLLENATAGASSATSLSTALTLTNCIQCAIEVLCTFGAASASGRLDIYGSLDGTNYTTAPIAAYELVLAASATSRQEFGVANFPPYIKCMLTNLDTGASITSISIFAVRQLVT